MSETALATYNANGAGTLTTADLTERRQLLANVIMRNGTAAQVDLVMHLCGRYGLDPLLKHIVLINGSPYVTRDGLLHIAHASGNFDGIEVELKQAQDGEWAATCTVWRKGSDRPIRYTAFEKEHKPRNVGNSAWSTYPRAMLTKCAEVMCLRRAFDVSLGAVEELGYDGQQPQSSIGPVDTLEPQTEEDPAALPAPKPKKADTDLVAILQDDEADPTYRLKAAMTYMGRAVDLASLNERHNALVMTLPRQDRLRLYFHHADRLGVGVEDYHDDALPDNFTEISFPTDDGYE